jgi:hypothetical protein
VDQQGVQPLKPTIYNGDLAKLPAALNALRKRPQWVIWKFTWHGKRWSKAPFRCDDPERHASSTDSSTWSRYKDAVVAAAHADGISFVLTPDDPFAAVDIDHVRDPVTGAIEGWAQRLLDQASRSYIEVSPSGTGLRIWGKADGEKIHRQFNFDGCALELFRHTHKILTVTGIQLGTSKTLGNIDALLDRAVVWGEQRKQKLRKAKPGLILGAGTLAQYSLEEIDSIVENGAPDGANRSDLFHSIVGHYVGCGWTIEQITDLLSKYPDNGIGNRYIAENRLAGEVERSAERFGIQNNPLGGMAWSNGFEPKAKPESKPASDPQPGPDSKPDLVTQADLDAINAGLAREGHAPPITISLAAKPASSYPDPVPDSDPVPNPDPKPDPGADFDPDADLDPDDELLENDELPQLFIYGDPDPRPLRPWAIKGLMPACGHGLLSGQWRTFKTFMAIHIGGMMMTGQPFIDYVVKRQCGVLFLAGEGQYELRPRIEAMVREKCGAMARAPFCWFEDVPVLLKRDGLAQLVAMARKADATLEAEFGLPLGLIIIDTIAASAGYTGLGAENDASINQQVMTVLKLAGQKADCFVLGVDHFGKDLVKGTRGSAAKEASCNLVLSLLGEREVSGRIVNTRLVVRKCRGGQSGREIPFGAREVELPERDEDGDPVKTLVLDFGAQAPVSTIKDPWEDERRDDARLAMGLLKRVVMSRLAKAGRDLPLDPPVRGIDREEVRKDFYTQLPTDGTEEQKQDTRLKRFNRTIDRACLKQLIGLREIDGITYLWPLLPPREDDDDEF